VAGKVNTQWMESIDSLWLRA